MRLKNDGSYPGTLGYCSCRQIFLLDVCRKAGDLGFSAESSISLFEDYDGSSFTTAYGWGTDGMARSWLLCPAEIAWTAAAAAVYVSRGSAWKLTASTSNKAKRCMRPTARSLFREPSTWYGDRSGQKQDERCPYGHTVSQGNIFYQIQWPPVCTT